MPEPTRRRRTPWVVAATIAALVVVAAGVFGFTRLQQPGDPAATAREFWQLVAAGKAQQALALTSTPSAPNGLLLTDAVYGGADRGVAHVEAGSFTTRGGEASGTVSYTQHGTPQTARVELRKVGTGFLRRPAWQITNAPLARVEVTVASGGQADSLSVDGHALPLPSGDGTIAIPALPGNYTFALGASSGLFSPVPQQVAVTGPTAAVTLHVTPSGQLGTQAVAQATAMLKGCFSQPTLSGDCPLGDGIRNVFNLTAEQSVTYQLTTAPKLAFDAKTMRVLSMSDGEITTTQSDAINAPFHNSADFSLALDVAVKAGKVVLTPQDGGIANTDLVCVNDQCAP